MSCSLPSTGNENQPTNQPNNEVMNQPTWKGDLSVEARDTLLTAGGAELYARWGGGRKKGQKGRADGEGGQEGEGGRKGKESPPISGGK